MYQQPSTHNKNDAICDVTNQIEKKANWKLCDICSIMYTDAEIKKAKWKLCDMCSIIYIEIRVLALLIKLCFILHFLCSVSFFLWSAGVVGWCNGAG